MDDRETMLIPLSLLGESCPFGNVSISLSCQNDFASIWCSPSLGYVFEHPKAGFTSQWICGVSFTCQYWTCVLKTALHSGLPYCFIFHASFKSLEGFVSNTLFPTLAALWNLCMMKTEEIWYIGILIARIVYKIYFQWTFVTFYLMILFSKVVNWGIGGGGVIICSTLIFCLLNHSYDRAPKLKSKICHMIYINPMRKKIPNFLKNFVF